MSDSTAVEGLVAIIERLMDENAALRRELASKQVVTVPGITSYPVIKKTTPPYTVTCTSGDAE